MIVISIDNVIALKSRFVEVTMPQHRDENMEPISDKSERAERRRELSNWFQEHANFCATVTSSGASVDSEGYHKVKSKLLASLERGKKLTQRAFEAYDEHSHHYFNESTGAGSVQAMGQSSLVFRRPTLPLSGGIPRFDEVGSHSHSASTAASAPAHFSNSGMTTARQASVISNINAVAQKVLPLPSRTYIKKSNS